MSSRFFFYVTTVWWLTTPGFSTTVAADTLCGRKFHSVKQIQMEIAHDPRSKIVHNDEASIQFEDRQELAIWTFLKPAHQASPAVICQTPVKTNGELSLSLQARCGGSKNDCDALIAEFTAHQEKLAKSIVEKFNFEKPANRDQKSADQ